MTNMMPTLETVRRLISRSRHFNDAVIVVSGLPRSGTSMLMQMLHQGGVPVMMDGTRQPDQDNPKGYYEYEAVKRLEQKTDTLWLHSVRGKAIKVISHLLKSLPEDNRYQVILIQRSIEEVLRSQNRMLERLGQPNPTPDGEILELYRCHLINTEVFLTQSSNFEVLNVSYQDTLANPLETARHINQYLGGTLDERKMAQAVVPGLCQNKADSTNEKSPLM